MIFEVTCDLRREITNLRDWDNNHKGRSRVAEPLSIADQLLFLEEYSLPWYSEIARNHSLAFVIVVPPLDDCATTILNRIRRNFKFVAFRGVADLTVKGEPDFGTMRWEHPVVTVPISPWELYTDEAFLFLERQCCGVSEMRRFVFERNYRATAHPDGIRRLRILEKAGSVVSIGYRFSQDPRHFSYKSVAAASYYNSLTRVTHSSGYLELLPPLAGQRSSGNAYPLVDFDWRSLPRQIENRYADDSGVPLVSSPVDLEDELALSCDVSGPFKISVDLELGDEIQAKSALFSFELVNASGERIESGRHIEGLACSASASIGYFFYLLSSTPGSNSFSHLVQLPEDVTCRKVRFRRWGDGAASIKLNSLSVEEQ